MGARWFRPRESALRRTAHVVEQMAPGGIDRDEPGRADREDIQRARRRLSYDLGRGSDDAARRDGLERSIRSVDRLERVVGEHEAAGVLYLEAAESRLPSQLRSAAIEVDFAFGDRDGRVSEADLAAARRRYAAVRGPVGWNRMLTTDELERRLFPRRVLSSSSGARLLPRDWQAQGRDPLIRLEELCERMDDGTLARTYADVAARYATCFDHEGRALFGGALTALARQIRARRGVRPTLTDIARIGCEDPRIKAILHSPMEMARYLRPELLERLHPI